MSVFREGAEFNIQRAWVEEFYVIVPTHNKVHRGQGNSKKAGVYVRRSPPERKTHQWRTNTLWTCSATETPAQSVGV